MAENIGAPKSTIFDDVFRTIAQKLPQLILPLINEVFHTSYDEENNVNVSFPNSCVLYIRSTKTVPEYHCAIIHFPDGNKVLYKIPVIKVSDYDLSEIFEKKLYLFIPYYLLKYENKIKAKRLSDKEADSIISDLMDMIRKLYENCMDQAQEDLYTDIMGFTAEILDHMLKSDHRLRERMEDVMGGNILKLRSEELREVREEGMEIGLKQGRDEGLSEGRSEEKKLIALRMYNAHMDINDISAMVDAPADEIEGWIKAE